MADHSIKTLYYVLADDGWWLGRLLPDGRWALGMAGTVVPASAVTKSELIGSGAPAPRLPPRQPAGVRSRA